MKNPALNNVWIMGSLGIKIFPGDEYLFNDETICNFISSLSLDLLNKFDISISKIEKNKWKVCFGKLSDEFELMN
jgi:hypothetical protein